MMKRILQFFIAILFCANAFGQDLYNIIATAYVTTTISQNVVFDNTMKQGGTFTFSVLAHNGGGRAGQSDTANVKIEFFNSSGGLITSTNSTNSGNLPNPNAVCGNPCIDPAVPWSTVTTSATLNSTQASQVAYAKISMYGIDGSYWAGDYGPWYRAPTFTLNSGSNMAYNPEFGPYNNITAQGWTSSPGFGSCQGAWGGSNACIVNSSGTPGTSTVGVTANMNGGGPSTTGGTTSGTPGGYNSTMTTTNATGGPPPPNPTKIYTTNTTTVRITNIWPTSNNSPSSEGAANAFDNNPNTKYLNFDKYNAGVTVKLSEGRVVSGFTITTANDFSGRDPTSYKLYGSNDGKTWVLISQGILNLSDSRFTTSGVVSVNNTNAYFYYYIQFPTTKAGDGCGLDCDSMQIAEISYIYDTNNTTRSTDLTTSGSTPVDPVQAVSAPQYPAYVTVGSGTAGNMTFGTSDGPTLPQQTKIDTWTNKTIEDGNKIYIQQINGDQNTVTMDQKGSKNLIRLQLTGTNNNITANQGVTGIGQNEMRLTFEGNNNVVNLNQARDTQGNQLGTNGHYLDATIAGWGTNLTVQQTNTGGVGGHYNETTISGNGNSVLTKQTDNGNKVMFVKVDGALNTVDAVQKGTGQHYLDAKLTGDRNSATVVQEGSVANRALLDLTNAGGPASVIVNQTGGQTVGVTTSCATAGGCAPITIRQGY